MVRQNVEWNGICRVRGEAPSPMCVSIVIEQWCRFEAHVDTNARRLIYCIAWSKLILYKVID